MKFENIEEMLQMQKELDNHILEKCKDKTEEEIFECKKTALATEIFELVNEDRFFKYWSAKDSDEKRKLEEAVDIIHFLLSITNDYTKKNKAKNKEILREWEQLFLDYDFEAIRLKGVEDKNWITQYTVSSVCDLRGQYNRIKFEKLCSSIGILLGRLNVDISKIYKEYKKKNKINHKRQEEGY